MVSTFQFLTDFLERGIWGFVETLKWINGSKITIIGQKSAEIFTSDKKEVAGIEEELCLDR